ncbi:histone-lysine n-methyltransferase [Moniliophthora roreri]|nr:histone-lysine n-methyltransferase [Moniliophthora roreri]
MSTYTIGQDEQLDEELEDPGLWEASSSEAEDWSGMDPDQEWPLHIAGEEVRDGKTRGLTHAEALQIVWETWSRKDRTNSTWNEEGIEGDDVLKGWKKESDRRRKKLAEESSDINIWSDLDLLSTDTHFHAQAGQEKLEASRKGRSHRPNLVERMRELEIKHGIQPQRQKEREEEEEVASSLRRRPSPGPSTRPAKRRQTTDPRGVRSTSYEQLRFISPVSTGPPPSVASSSSASEQTRSSSTRSGSSTSYDQLRFISPISMGPPPSVAGSSSASGQTRSSSTLSSSAKSLRKLSETPVSSTSTPNLKRHSTDSDVTMREASTSSSARKRGRPHKGTSIKTITSDSEDDDNHSMTLRETPARRERPATPSQVSVKGKEKAVPQARIRRAPSEVYIRGPRSVQKGREILQREWNAAAKLVSAKGITIVNDIDDEEIPVLDSDFEYLENDYVYDVDKEIPDPEGFFEFCTHRSCTKAKKCGCQQAHPVLDSNNSPTFPYSADNEGYFIYYDEVDNDGSAIPPLTIINILYHDQYCKCGPDCPNRVAQRPRDVPVEIFKTEECGWGVRSPQDIEQGKVLGLYTGKIIYRHVAEKMRGAEKAYCFDLDGTEDGTEETVDEDRSYTVDSRLCGNWTRFLK